ncbi:MAG: tetratricopeptide repeat protein, partial [Candidatus Gastranaerophilaceae bacterium]
MNFKKGFICIFCLVCMFLAQHSCFANDKELLKQGLEFYEKGKYEQAIPVLNQYLTNHPQNYSATCLLGMSLCKHGDIKSAIKVFNFATDVDPYRSDAYGCLGEIYSTLKQHDAAIKCYDKILTLPNLKAADKKYYSDLKKVAIK